MNRLRVLSGGQPLRSNDWGFIQDATASVIKSLVEGLKGTSGACIVSGLEVTINYETSTISVTEGVLFDGTELGYCPAFSGTYHGGEVQDGQITGAYTLYFTPAVTTGESRVFKDTTTQNVWEYRNYVLGYDATVPSGSIQYPEKLLDLITAHVIENSPPVPEQVVKYVRKQFTAASLAQWQSLIAAPGSYKAIKIISLSARIVPSTALSVDNQVLNVFYGTDPSETGIGSFPTSFLESATELHYDMDPVHARVYNNTNVGVGLNNETLQSGSANIVIYCYYAIITL